MNGGYIRGHITGVSAGDFYMNGGVISGNKVPAGGSGGNYSGGGVTITDKGYFRKTGGVIYGSNEPGFDEDDRPLKNFSSNGASAVFVTIDTWPGSTPYTLAHFLGKAQENTVSEDHNLLADRVNDSERTEKFTPENGWYEED